MIKLMKTVILYQEEQILKLVLVFLTTQFKLEI